MKLENVTLTTVGTVTLFEVGTDIGGCVPLRAIAFQTTVRGSGPISGLGANGRPVLG